MNMYGQRNGDQRYQDHQIQLSSKSNSLTSEDYKKIIQDSVINDATVDQVKVLTYNIFMRPPLVKNNEDDYKNERHKLFIKNEMDKFDIICFQELFRLFSNRRHKMVYSGIKKGFLYHVSSPSPSFFKSYFVDGGLTILSKHPIVQSKFTPYSYGILADGLSQKGVLYAKIKINDKYLHLFNTHTQASYITTPDEIVKNNLINNISIIEYYQKYQIFKISQNLFQQFDQIILQKQTVIARLDQFKEMRAIVEKSLLDNGYSRGDLCLFAGDFNVDSNNPIHPIHFLEKQKQLKEYLGIQDYQEFFDEYKALITLLSGKGKDVVIDIGREQNNGLPPITFGDVFRDQNGQIQPLETALTDHRDLKSLQSLDYIMNIIPNGMMIDGVNSSNKTIIQMNRMQNGAYSLSDSSQSLKFSISSKQNMNKQLSIDIKKSKIEKFYIQGQKFTQLSDHYGVSTTIRYQ